jgi:hypothetical protein
LNATLSRELFECFSYILTADDCYETKKYLIKDLSKLLGSRFHEQIYVVDFDEKKMDSSVQAIILKNKFDGTSYKDLRYLN